MTYEEAVKELYYTLYGHNPTNFHTLLYTLIGKADLRNKVSIALGFPIECQVWIDWHTSENVAEFFGKFGLKVPG